MILADRRDMKLGVLALFLFLAGCNSAAMTGGFATTPGDSVLVGGVTRVTLTSLGGGFHGNPPSGAACDPSKWEYTVNFGDQTQFSNTCSVTGDGTAPTDYVPDMLLVSLDTQWPTVEGAIAAVTVSGKRLCGADADHWTFTVARGDATQLYGDDFFGCQTTYSEFVTRDSLASLLTVLSANK